MYQELVAKGMIKAEDEPIITGLDYYMDAFNELSTCRSSGMGLGPIPFTAIVDYARVFEVEDFEEFSYLIRRMDDAFLSEEAESRKRGNNGGKTDQGNHNQDGHAGVGGAQAIGNSNGPAKQANKKPAKHR